MTADGQDGHQGRGATHEVCGNRLTLLPGGPDRLAALLDLVDGAQHRLDLFFYMVVNDAAGARLVAALCAAQARGVAVTLLVDAFGSAFTPDALFEPLMAAGGRFGRFGNKRSTRYLIRNHQKMAIADGRLALVGGFNVQDSYFAPDDDPQAWRDFGLLVDGPLASELMRWFDGLARWTLSEKQSFRSLRAMVRNWQPGEHQALWLVGGPTRHLNGWARRVKHDLQAGTRLDMAAAYFSPGRGMVGRMVAIAKRGSARLVVTERSDNRPTVGAARHLYARLLRGGVAVLEFVPQKLHIKLLAIDEVAYVGSANFDMRGLFLNVELMLRIEDAGFAAAIRAEIDGLAASSLAIDPATYRVMASPLRKLIWWFDFLLVGVLDYTVTRRLNFRRRRRG